MNKILHIIVLANILILKKEDNNNNIKSNNSSKIKDNIKLMQNHNKTIKKSMYNLNILHSKIRTINNRINNPRTDGLAYNKLINNYSNLVDQYNSKKSNFCSHLPSLYKLKNIKIYKEKKKKCLYWYNKGFEVGNLIFKVYYHLGLFKRLNHTLIQKFRCIPSNILFKKRRSKCIRLKRKCFIKGYYKALKISYNKVSHYQK